MLWSDLARFDRARGGAAFDPTATLSVEAFTVDWCSSVTLGEWLAAVTKGQKAMSTSNHPVTCICDV